MRLLQSVAVTSLNPPPAAWVEVMTPYTSSASELMVTILVPLFLTLTSNVTTASFAVFNTCPLGVATTTGTWKVSSHTHFDFVSGAKFEIPPLMSQAVDWPACQLVQLGRFKNPSPSVSVHETPGIVKVSSYVPEFRSPQVSPSRFSAGATPGVSLLREHSPLALLPSPLALAPPSSLKKKPAS
jgi:hypothetical protein